MELRPKRNLWLKQMRRRPAGKKQVQIGRVIDWLADRGGNAGQRRKEGERTMGEDPLLERVTAAAEERHPPQNTLIAYQRPWLKLTAWMGAGHFRASRSSNGTENSINKCSPLQAAFRAPRFGRNGHLCSG
jgi:hypothetical protein